MPGRIQQDGQPFIGHRLIHRNGRAETTQPGYRGFRVVGVEFQVHLHTDVG
ncbi:hypothetical protein SAMN05216377_13513 [Pseudonocardia oroxyli]|uniref:Uncharacterized protein n=1 Tax=Pseudonocardia oroxyli TaxID=366584 RepID=A0A1G8EFH8_PSEOR|nr:hypothetical protein SAMN05216377_13513 [Pseudonocardia oroxyli]